MPYGAKGSVTMATITKSEFAALCDVLPVAFNGRPVNGNARQFKPNAKTGKSNCGFNIAGSCKVFIGQEVPHSEWEQKGPALKLTVNGMEYDIPPKTFGTGSLGWNFNIPVMKELTTGHKVAGALRGNVFVPDSGADDTEFVMGHLSCRISANATISGSDKWPQGEQEPTDVERGTTEFINAMSKNTESFVITKDDVGNVT